MAEILLKNKWKKLKKLYQQLNTKILTKLILMDKLKQKLIT